MHARQNNPIAEPLDEAASNMKVQSTTKNQNIKADSRELSSDVTH